MTAFTWTKQRTRAAQLVAEDKLTDAQIAAELGVGKATLERWKQRPAFAARVREIVAATRAALQRKGIAERQNRVDALNDRHRRLQQVVEARAADPSMADVPGGPTGLLVRQVKQIGQGSGAQVVEEYAVDTGLLNEFRQHEMQAAKELGQWTEKRELTGKDGGPLQFELSDAEFTDKLTAELARIAARVGAAGVPQTPDPLRDVRER